VSGNVAVAAGALFASSLMLTPRFARGQPFGCPNSLPANSSTTLPPLQNLSVSGNVAVAAGALFASSLMLTPRFARSCPQAGRPS
jgi:hypothetical protein